MLPTEHINPGFSSNCVTIPSDNLDDYDRHVKSYFDALQPKGPIEADLVRCLADTAWRLHRIKALEDNFMFLPLDVQAKSVAAMRLLPASLAPIRTHRKTSARTPGRPGKTGRWLRVVRT